MISRRRRSLLGALFAALLTTALAVFLAPALPAQADSFACGPQQTVRVSIHYRECVAPGSSGKVIADIWIQNNHGSPVKSAWLQRQSDNTARGKITLPAGRTDVYQKWNCKKGKTYQFYGTMNKKNNSVSDGNWGYPSAAPKIKCPS
jgi:hypothetical protein